MGSSSCLITHTKHIKHIQLHLEPFSHLHKLVIIIDADAGGDTDHEMNEQDEQKNDVSIEESTVPPEGDASIQLIGINSLAIVSPQRNPENDGQVNNSTNLYDPTVINYTGKTIRATPLRTGLPKAKGTTIFEKTGRSRNYVQIHCSKTNVEIICNMQIYYMHKMFAINTIRIYISALLYTNPTSQNMRYLTTMSAMIAIYITLCDKPRPGIKTETPQTHPRLSKPMRIPRSPPTLQTMGEDQRNRREEKEEMTRPSSTSTFFSNSIPLSISTTCTDKAKPVLTSYLNCIQFL